eukprot:16452337-Heterocapsa_arctica.AAC.1
MADQDHVACTACYTPQGPSGGACRSRMFGRSACSCAAASKRTDFPKPTARPPWPPCSGPCHNSPTSPRPSSGAGYGSAEPRLLSTQQPHGQAICTAPPRSQGEGGVPAPLLSWQGGCPMHGSLAADL